MASSSHMHLPLLEQHSLQAKVNVVLHYDDAVVGVSMHG